MSTQLTAAQKKSRESSEALGRMARAKHSEIVSIFGGNSQYADKFVTDLKLLALNPNIRSCKPGSVFTAALSAAQLGLSIVPQKGEAYVVPYKEDASLQIGYKGWLRLAKESGMKVKCFLVYEGDDFDVDYEGGDLKIHFKPDLLSRDDADPAWVEKNLKAAIVSIKEGDEVTETFVSGQTLRKIKAQNPAVSRGSNSPWNVWAAEMYMGKAIKYVLTKTAMSDKFATAAAIENQAEQKMLALAPPSQQAESGVVSESLLDSFVGGDEEQMTPFDPSTIDHGTGEVMSQ